MLCVKTLFPICPTVTFIIVVTLVAMLALIVGIVYWTKSKPSKRAGNFSSVLSMFLLISVVSLLITQTFSITVTSRSPREMVKICMVGQQDIAKTFLSFDHRNID